MLLCEKSGREGLTICAHLLYKSEVQNFALHQMSGMYIGRQ